MILAEPTWHQAGTRAGRGWESITGNKPEKRRVEGKQQ